MNTLELSKFEVLNLTNQEVFEIDGGLEAPSTKTMVTGAVVTIVFGPLGGLAFWAGYYTNQ